MPHGPLTRPVDGVTPANAASIEPIYDALEATYTTTEVDTALNAKLATADAPELIRDTMGTALVAGSNVTITPNDGADTITIAASGGGVVPGYRAGSYISGMYSGMGWTSAGTVALAANTLYLHPLFLPRAATVSRIDMQVTTASAGGSARLGIFRVNDTLTEATLVLDAGTVSTSTAGVKEIMGLAQVLEAGWYFIGVLLDQACTVNSYAPMKSLHLSQSANASGTWSGMITKAVTYATFAASYTGFAFATSQVPRMGFLV